MAAQNAAIVRSEAVNFKTAERIFFFSVLLFFIICITEYSDGLRKTPLEVDFYLTFLKYRIMKSTTKIPIMGKTEQTSIPVFIPSCSEEMESFSARVIP